MSPKKLMKKKDRNSKKSFYLNELQNHFQSYDQAQSKSSIYTNLNYHFYF